MTFKKLADWEENKVYDLIERVAEKYPDYFWNDPPEKPKRPLAWETYLLDFWPGILSIGYWYYKFGNLEKGHSGGYSADRWINLPEWGEIRYLFQQYSAKSRSYKWHLNPKLIWTRLWEETKTERLICRFKHHPKGEVYWNSGGDEPDHHCSTCGEFIG